jgi:hypothetical protein
VQIADPPVNSRIARTAKSVSPRSDWQSTGCSSNHPETNVCRINCVIYCHFATLHGLWFGTDGRNFTAAVRVSKGTLCVSYYPAGVSCHRNQVWAQTFSLKLISDVEVECKPHFIRQILYVMSKISYKCSRGEKSTRKCMTDTKLELWAKLAQFSKRDVVECETCVVIFSVNCVCNIPHFKKN